MKLNIGAKLALGFGAVMLVLGAAAGYGVWQLNNVSSTFTYVDETRTAAVLEVFQLRANFDEMVWASKNVLLRGTDREDFDKYVAQIDEYGKVVEQNEALLSARETLTAEQKQLLAAFIQEHDEFEQAWAQALAAYNAASGGNQAEADAIMEDKGTGASQPAVELVRSLRTEAQNEIAATRTVASTSIKITLALTVIAIVIAIGVAVFLSRGISGNVAAVVRAAQALAAGDLTQRAEVHSGDEIGALANAFNSMADNLHQMASQIHQATGNISTVTAETMAVTNQQAATASQQAAAVSETSTTVQEVRQTAEQAADRARLVAEASQESTAVADQGLRAVQDAIEGMNSVKEQVGAIAETILALSEQTQQIGEIIATVNDIADQSNLLALNAAIEAARAGEAGKGFAVVAGEVRSLAEQSVQATAQVRDILSEIQKATNTAVMVTEEGTKRAEEGVGRAQATGEAFHTISQHIQQVAQAAQQIAASANQQLVGMDQIGSAMDSINQATTQTEAGTRQVEGAAQNLNALAAQLTGLVEQYKLE